MCRCGLLSVQDKMYVILWRMVQERDRERDREREREREKLREAL